MPVGRREAQGPVAKGLRHQPKGKAGRSPEPQGGGGTHLPCFSQPSEEAPQSGQEGAGRASVGAVWVATAPLNVWGGGLPHRTAVVVRRKGSRGEQGHQLFGAPTEKKNRRTLWASGPGAP